MLHSPALSLQDRHTAGTQSLEEGCSTQHLAGQMLETQGGLPKPYVEAEEASRGSRQGLCPPLTSWEMPSRGASCWLMAAREAWSTSRMHLLRTSMASSHSRCPGALSLRDRQAR